MHGACADCHQEEALKQDRPALEDCSTCHKSLGPPIPPAQAVAAGLRHFR
jgi:hypothetical protein